MSRKHRQPTKWNGLRWPRQRRAPLRETHPFVATWDSSLAFPGRRHSRKQLSRRASGCQRHYPKLAKLATWPQGPPLGLSSPLCPVLHDHF